MTFRFLTVLLVTSFIQSNLSAADIVVPKDLSLAAKHFRAKVRFDLKPETCAEDLRQIYLKIYNFKPTYFKNVDDSLNDPDLSENPLNTFFKTRLEIHKKFKQWSWGNRFENYEQANECAKLLKVANRTLRGFEEYWGLRKIVGKDLDGEVPSPALFQGGWPYRMISDKYANDYKFPSATDAPQKFSPGSLKTGDMLLTRGTAFSSAAISRIGDIDNQFSHLALVWIDKEGIYSHYDKKNDKNYPAKKNQVFLLESLLEGGVQVSIMEEWATHDFGRMVHFRYKGDGSKTEEELQAIRDKSAELLFVRAKILHGEVGHINYNYSMKMNSLSPGGDPNKTTLFCSQAISYAYKLGCEAIAGSENSTTVCPRPSYTPENRIFPFPMVYSRLPVDKNPLARMLGITGDEKQEVFAPADIEIDPQVEIIAEWRNYSLSEGRRIHDIAMTKLFQWMELGGYHFRSDMQAYEKLVQVANILVKQFGYMPPETPVGFVRGTGLMAFLLEAPGIRKDAVDGVVELIKNKDQAAIAEFISGFGVDIPKDKIQLAVNAVYPPLKVMAESGQLKRFLVYKGFTSRLKELAEYHKSNDKILPTDFMFDRALDNTRIKFCQDFHAENPEVRLHDFFAESFKEGEKRCSQEIDYASGQRFDWRKIW